MGVNTAIFIKNTLQTVFFLALLGCTTTVLISWAKLLRDAFSSDDEDDAAPAERKPGQRPGSI